MIRTQAENLKSETFWEITSDSVDFRGNMTRGNDGHVEESAVLRKMSEKKNKKWNRNQNTSWNTWRMACRGGFVVFVAGCLWVMSGFTPSNSVWAQIPTPGVYVPENPGNILPGTFNPEGNFANATVSGENTSKNTENTGNVTETPQSPSAFLREQNGNSLGSEELISGGNRAETALPESHAMEIAPVNQSVGGSTEALLTSGGQGTDELPASADVNEMVTPAETEEAPTSLLGGVESHLTRGNEHEGKEVIDVQILGNERYTTEKIMQQILLRPGHKFRATGLDDDILRLNQSRLFTLVEPYIRSVPGGVTVIFKVQERPVMRYLRFQGNGSIMIGTLEKECGLIPGKPFSPYDVEEGRKKIETFYNSKGYTRASVKTIQGDQKGDPGVIFLINPGPKLRIKKTDFIGNTIASDARLKTVIQSKPGFMRIFRGELQEEALQNDIRTLEDYYRRLGFFYARIGRRVIRTSEDGWNEVTFVIHEGPQANIREIRFVGNSQFDASMLLEDMKVFEGKPYNKDRLDMSIIKVRRRYGREGYVFADINAETKILDDPGQCDVVFSIKEGKTYRVGRVNVLIEGEFPHTQISTVLNRLSVKPGDLVNVYELQQSERRLKSSQLFAVDAAQGKMPKIVYAPPELQESEEIAAQIGTNADAVAGSGTTEHRNAVGNGGGSASTSAGNASIGGGAGRSALSGGTTRKTYKMTAADVAEDFQLAENEAFLDVNIYTTLRPVENQNETVENAENSVTEYQSETLKQAEPIEGQEVETLEMEKFWCMEIVDRDTGKCYRSYEFPETEADLYLDGRACVSNDDPKYEKEPVAVCDTSLPRSHVVRYSPEENVQGYANYTENTQNYTENTQSNVPLQRIPVYEETDETESMIVRGNNTESTPSWASPELAEAEPAAQIAEINPRTGQAMSPPPQPGISNPDLTPYSQHIGDPPTDGYSLGDWQRYSLPITAQMEETTTGRVMFSLGVSSDSGLVGSVVVDEQNFDIRRWPTSWSEIKNGTSWRGRGQHFRMELTPGTEVSRYVVSFDEPYLFNSQIGLGTSAMYYERQYRYWDERRVGGQFNFSRALTHDMRAYIGFRGYDVYLDDPVSPTPPRLANALGHSSLFGFSFRLVHDRRDSSFLATEGYYASIELEQVVGTWSYPRFNAQFKKYWLLYERADMSGRHVLSFTSSFSWTGDDTPIYESYFAGGSSTIRGFEYRGVSPLEYDYAVGGNMMILASLEYLFPITADDNIRGVIFCDTGTVQPSIDQWEDAYRVSIGAGFRISMPMLGPAPMALDFAVPLVKEDGDRKELFSFTMGLQR